MGIWVSQTNGVSISCMHQLLQQSGVQMIRNMHKRKTIGLFLDLIMDMEVAKVKCAIVESLSMVTQNKDF